MTPLAKRLGLLLAVSIGLNLLLGGMWIGRGMRDRPRHRGFLPAQQSPGMAGRRHPILRQAFEAQAPEFARHRAAARGARRRVVESLERTPFNRAEFEAALGALRKEHLATQELMHRELSNLAERGTPEVRRDIGRTFSRDRP